MISGMSASTFASRCHPSVIDDTKDVQNCVREVFSLAQVLSVSDHLHRLSLGPAAVVIYCHRSPLSDTDDDDDAEEAKVCRRKKVKGAVGRLDEHCRNRRAAFAEMHPVKATAQQQAAARSIPERVLPPEAAPPGGHPWPPTIDFATPQMRGLVLLLLKER